jgi:hypothetical protein
MSDFDNHATQTNDARICARIESMKLYNLSTEKLKKTRIPLQQTSDL